MKRRTTLYGVDADDGETLVPICGNSSPVEGCLKFILIGAA
jgi:hypothetical protein